MTDLQVKEKIPLSKRGLRGSKKAIFVTTFLAIAKDEILNRVQDD